MQDCGGGYQVHVLVKVQVQVVYMPLIDKYQLL